MTIAPRPTAAAATSNEGDEVFTDDDVDIVVVVPGTVPRATTALTKVPSLSRGAFLLRSSSLSRSAAAAAVATVTPATTTTISSSLSSMSSSQRQIATVMATKEESHNDTKKKKVQFGQINIYYCAVALGDSPSVTSGPPICLGPVVRHSVTTLPTTTGSSLTTMTWTDEWSTYDETTTTTTTTTAKITDGGRPNGGEKDHSSRSGNHAEKPHHQQQHPSPKTAKMIRQEMKLTSDERVIMLLSAGVGRKEIEAATIAAWSARYDLLEALRRRRAKKERTDSFRRFFTTLFSSQEEALAATVANQPVRGTTTNNNNNKAKQPLVRAAMAC